MGRTATLGIAYLGLLVAMTATAQASRTPFTPAPAARSPDAWTIAMGPAGAMLESDYFRAPHGIFKGGTGRCQLYRQGTADSLRLAYACR